MIIGFTGTQKGMTKFQQNTLKEILIAEKCTEFHHGDCIGADNESTIIALQAGVRLFTIHPPDNPKKRAWIFNNLKVNRNYEWLELNDVDFGLIKVRWMPVKPYFERNHCIVDSTNLVLATPKEHTHTLRSGTWHTIRYAWHVKKKIIIIPPIERPIEEQNEV